MKKSKVKIIFFISLFLILFFGSLIIYENATATDVPRLFIVYPKEKSFVGTQDGKCYIFGQLIPSVSQLTINGEKVDVDEDGAFIYYGKLKIQEINPDSVLGHFDFSYSKDDYKNKFRHTLQITPIMKTSPDDELVFDEKFTNEPNQNLVYQPDDILNVTVKGTPGCEAFFTIDGFKQKFPMAQTHIFNQYIGEVAFGNGFDKKPDKIFGIYKGHLILPKTTLDNAKITAHLVSEKYGSISKVLSGNVSINLSNQYDIAEILDSDNLTIGRTGPGLGYRLFLSKGMKAIIDGQRGDWLRLKLSNVDHIFVPKNSVKILPAGTPPPQSTIEAIRTRVEQNFVRIELGFKENLAYEVLSEIDQKKITLRIFGATADFDWIRYDETNDLIKNIKWKQSQDNILEVEIDLNSKHLWGYYAFYEENVLVIKIKKPPVVSKKFLFWGSSLSERKIVIDPGHNPEWGAIGPRKTKEKDINLKISLKLKEILENKGAKVFFTHQTEPLPLTKRKQKVLSYEPDISVSIHNNAVPDGVNPLVHNGSSVYYYNPNARLLAKSIHQSLFNKLNMVDFGLYWDNLYMCRINETIAVLIEPAFMIHPEQEKNLLSESYQEKIAQAIADGIENFFDKIRE